MVMSWVIGLGILVLIVVASSEKAESIMQLSEE
ncbi:hypothetical protein DFP95_104143 [Cohnella lupini]|uniref:Uncharacterized protein n=1 Tax=Cohnella lupini TaxID=1294267 RepID=A0A3D9INR9_9BACL|nr:hypothetical protein DFP95_104143 [Cohnella lupini]